MWKWTWKSLLTERASVAGSVLGIGVAFLLVIFFDAVWQGESEQIVVYPRKMDADIWVMQRGVENMHMATSFVWDWKADRIARIPGVTRVTPILYLSTAINIGNDSSFNYVVGLEPGNPRAGPWELSEGRHVEQAGEAVIPDVLGRLTGAGVGDVVRIADKELTIVGLSAGTYSAGNPITFVSMSDLEDILTSTGTYSFLLVDTVEGVDAETVIGGIMAEVDKVTALTQDEFIANDFSMAVQMGVEIIFMMTLICSGLAALIIGFASYSIVVQRRRQLAIVKALGVTNRRIAGSVVIQALAVTLGGLIGAVAAAAILIPWIPGLLPQLTLSLSAASVLRTSGLALVVAALGALIPGYQVSKLDPATAFHV